MLNPISGDHYDSAVLVCFCHDVSGEQYYFIMFISSKDIYFDLNV